jgi:hypothetical protein
MKIGTSVVCKDFFKSKMVAKFESVKVEGTPHYILSNRKAGTGLETFLYS